MTTKSHTKVTRDQVLEAGGGNNALARALGISHQAPNFWKKIPAHHVLACERITGFSRYQIRPDIFGDKPPRKTIRPKKVA